MQFYNPCPVCAQMVTAGARRCPRCNWELESDYVLGRLTAQAVTAQREQLLRARQDWRKRLQRETTQQALVAAQANLARLQRQCEKARRYGVAPPDPPPLRRVLTPAPEGEAGQPAEGHRRRHYSPWHPRHWGAFLAWLFLGSNTAHEPHKP
jgi:hypothetical protein